jgi:Mitochondrial carrier protein
MSKKDNSVTLSTKTIFGVTLTSSVINRTFTQSIEICNTRILKNVGLVHL